VVSYHSFIINICRSIGAAIAGLVMANYNAQIIFSIQAICYLISLILFLPLKFEQPHYNEVEKQMSIKFVFEYFKDNSVGTRIFVTSLFIMASGFTYTSLLPVLTDKTFPEQVTMFGTAMTCCAIGG